MTGQTTTMTATFGWPALIVLLLANGTTAAEDPACPMDAVEPAPDGARLVIDTLWAGRPERPYPPSAYRKVRDGYLLCTCAIKPCVRKCCNPNKAYNKVNGKNQCSPFNESLGTHDHFTVPKFVNGSGTIDSYETDQFHLVYGKLTCLNKNNTKYRLVPSVNSTDNYRVSETGWLQNEYGLTIVPPGLFCLEQFSEYNFQIAPIVCDLPISDGINMFYTIAMILSLPFLFSTFLVYALIRELRNLHGKSLMCHVATLLVAYTSLIVVQFIPNTSDNKFCSVLAYIMQFSFLASFFWLNVMCFDLWWTFSRFRPPRGNLKEYEAKQFVFYSLYAWGCTSLISMCTIFMESSLNIFTTVIRPGFGDENCWFSSKYATVLYFYGPIGILLFSNLLMFIYTAIMIVKHMRDAKVLNGSDSKRNVDHEKQRFMLYLKLFVVMGVNWLAEIVSWALRSDDSTFNVWFVTDIGNSLQGVFIFLIFVCKKRVLILLNKKLCPRFQLFKKTSNSVSTRTTNSTISRTSTKIRDLVEMTPTNIQNLTSNQLHDFKV